MDSLPKTLLSVSIVDSGQAFFELADDWNRLVKQCGGSVFLRHEWFDAAWAWRKEDSNLFIFLAWKGNELVGIFPLVRVEKKERFPRLRSVEFLTVPDTQTCDLIAEPKDRSIVAHAFCGELYKRRNEWDQLSLRYLNDKTSALHDLEAGLAEHRYVSDVKIQGPNLFVNLESSWDTYYGSRTRSLKKANNLAANRLKKAGQIAIQWVTSESADEKSVANALQQAIAISRHSWKQNTGNSLDQSGPGAFISALTKHAARNGWLSLWLLSIDGNALAMEYQLLDAGNVYALRADFDAEHEEISPGSHLMRTLLELLFEPGLKRYYMGPGENAYKTRWTEESVILKQLVVHNRTWRGQIVHVVDDILKPAARRIRNRLTSMNPCTTIQSEARSAK